MKPSNIKTPGVYINEINAFPNAIAGVETAVPAFIGYTPQAIYEGKSYLNIPTRITSFADFKAIYCFPDPPVPASPSKQYSPAYYLVQQDSQPEKGDYITIDGVFYTIVPDPDTIFYMYNSIRLFYENGGGSAYIVSVGTYGKPSKNYKAPEDQIINQNVKLNELLKGVDSLKKYKEPTMYICPEATLLSIENNGTLMQEMLLQNSELKSAISIFDVIGGRNPDPITYTDDILTFRNNTGSNGLSYGTVYYPFLGTTIMQADDIDYTNLFGGDVSQLRAVINPSSNPNEAVGAILSSIESSTSGLTVAQNNIALINASKKYSNIVSQVLSIANILPPSGAMAGVITTNDNQQGVWNAPANTSIVGASSLPIRLNETQQAGLNVDAVSGKSINAIRFFNGLGILVWGARTLDGNSLDWKYLAIRRTMIFLEQSCQLAMEAFVFQENDINTWEQVKSMIGRFLKTIWNEGGLQGSTAADAYSVSCGLGTTMTSEDVSNGIMRVAIKVEVVHPAEFIMLELEQEMSKT